MPNNPLVTCDNCGKTLGRAPLADGMGIHTCVARCTCGHPLRHHAGDYGTVCAVADCRCGGYIANLTPEAPDGR